MKRIFNLLLVTCGLVLAIHLVMTLVTEYISNSRWAQTKEGRIGVKTMANRMVEPFEHGGDPANSALVLNFRGDEDPLTIDAVDSWIYFNFEGRDQAAQTGWVGPGIGLLVIDPDDRGQVTSGRQLVGNRTLEGDPRQLTGFAALATLDGNGDGLIDRRDVGWSRLRVWLDRKPDGQVGPNELYTLEQLNIEALELKARPENRPLLSSNYLHTRGSFIQGNGRRGSLDEVFFQRRANLRRYSDGLTVSPEIAAAVPDLKGSGRMRNLREALMQSPKLGAVYQRYQGAVTRQEQLALMDELLEAWAEAGGPAPTMAERLGDRYDLTDNCLEAMNPDRLRRLKVLEAWSDQPFYLLPHELYPGQELRPGVEATEDGGRSLAITCPDVPWQQLVGRYNSLSNRTYEQLLKSTRLKRFYDRLEPKKKDGPPLVLALFDDEFALDPDQALTDLLEFRLNLAQDKADAELGPALDAYIKARVKQAYFTEDQIGLYGRLPASARPEMSSAESDSESGKPSEPGGKR